MSCLLSLIIVPFSYSRYYALYIQNENLFIRRVLQNVSYSPQHAYCAYSSKFLSFPRITSTPSRLTYPIRANTSFDAFQIFPAQIEKPDISTSRRSTNVSNHPLPLPPSSPSPTKQFFHQIISSMRGNPSNNYNSLRKSASVQTQTVSNASFRDFSLLFSPNLPPRRSP